MKNLTEGVHYYLTKEGLVVFTSAYHLEKGYCCGMGCLHCPFDYRNVEEPRRTRLLNERKGREKNG